MLLRQGRRQKAGKKPKPRLRNSRLKDARQDRLGKVIIALCVLAGAGAVAAYSAYSPVSRNPGDLCPATGEAGLELVVVDKSDSWNNAQINRLTRVINNLKDHIQKDYRLSIFTFQDNVEYGFEPVFSVCSPGQQGETNKLFANPKKVQNEFDEKFGKPLTAVLQTLQKPAAGNNSPILEVLTDLTLREEFRRVEGQRRITIISDMIQHTPTLSLFNNTGATLDPKAASSAVGADSYDGFTVKVYQIKSGKYSNERLQEARRFWQRWADTFNLRMEWADL
ncbi:hypothetical protein ACSV5G_10745 [Agrobacterium cavarae]|uniref:hypothetical protein n=1 Tax=Agrobacterium cavarae TaxID=2528239 RepID=UPI003FD47BBF